LAFVKPRRLSPVPAHPKHPPPVTHPMAADPNRVRMRPNRPMTSAPNPTAMPYPRTGNPNICRSGRDCYYFSLRRWRNFARWRRFRRNCSVLLRGRSGRWRGGVRRSHGHSRRWRWRLTHINNPSFYASR
jgi:hypothetical protein